MAFNPDNDKILASTDADLDGGIYLGVSVNSYNNGEPKIQISRFKRSGDNVIYMKVGRMTFDEFDEVVDMVNILKQKITLGGDVA